MKKTFRKCSTLPSYSKYEGDADDSDRRWLFQSFIPLARHRAKRFLWSGYSLAELTSVACAGLGEAVKKYDPDEHDNGMAAYAIPWIDGALKRHLTKTLSIVSGERNEDSRYKPKSSHVVHFGNVAKGDGQPCRDISLDEELYAESDNNDDDEGCGGSLIDNCIDHRLEDFRGNRFHERLKSYRRGVDLTLRYRRGQWRIRHPRLDHDAHLFYADRKEFYRRGIGYFLRSRRMDKCRREILPFRPPPADPLRSIRLADKQTQILLSDLGKHVKLGPAKYCRGHSERVKLFERMMLPAFVSKAERNASQPEWKRLAPKSKWKIETRAKLKSEHATLFWSDDSLSNYEIWTEPTYSRSLYESYFRPHRVPWLTAGLVLDKNQKPAGHTQHSPSLMGESDYGFKDVGFCLENWTALGHAHKRRVSEVNQEIVLRKHRNRPLPLKPDSRLVLLFWARQIVMSHYLRYWHPTEKIDARHELQETG
jgi:hypothetical protein